MGKIATTDRRQGVTAAGDMESHGHTHTQSK